MSGTTRRRIPDLRVVHEALSLATLAALVVHALALLGDSFMPRAWPTSRSRSSAATSALWTSIGIVAGWMLILLGLSYYVRGRIGPARWRSLHRFTALAWVLGIVHSLGEGTDAGAAWFLLTAAAIVLPCAALLRSGSAAPAAAPAAR